MPKSARGGKRVTSSFGSGGGGGGANPSANPTNTPPVATQPPVQSAPPQPQPPVQQAQPVQPQQQPAPVQNQQTQNTPFPDKSDAAYHEMNGGARQYYLNQNATPAQQQAFADYLDPTTESMSANAAARAGGGLYSKSQDLNYAIAHNLPLSQAQQTMKANLDSSLHNLGDNLLLTRYDHPDWVNAQLQGLVGKNYDKLSESQLKKLLVGSSYSQNQYLSTSYNHYVNAPSNNPFTSRCVKIVYHAPASTQCFMPGIGAGGNLGEIVLAPQNNGKITDVKIIGNKGRIKKTQNYSGRVIQIDIQL